MRPCQTKQCKVARDVQSADGFSLVSFETAYLSDS